MKALFLMSLFLASSAFAAKVEDVSILDVTNAPDSVELKLHAKAGPVGSFFFVTIVKTDTKSFDKLALVTKKLSKGNAFQLDLNIISFSMSPSGSTYRSDGVNFRGVDLAQTTN